MSIELQMDCSTNEVSEVHYTPTPAIPEAVTMRQARLALLGAGILSQVDSAIASFPSPQKEAAQIEWEYAMDVRRDNALINAIGPALGMTPAQIDTLFITAATL